MIDFETWFVAQFGKRDQGRGTDADLLRLRDERNYVVAELARREQWDAQHTAALYAWQARERKP